MSLSVKDKNCEKDSTQKGKLQLYFVWTFAAMSDLDESKKQLAQVEAALLLDPENADLKTLAGSLKASSHDLKQNTTK